MNITNYKEARKIAEKETGIKFTQCGETADKFYFTTYKEQTGGVTIVYKKNGKVESKPFIELADEVKNIKKGYNLL